MQTAQLANRDQWERYKNLLLKKKRVPRRLVSPGTIDPANGDVLVVHFICGIVTRPAALRAGLIASIARSCHQRPSVLTDTGYDRLRSNLD